MTWCIDSCFPSLYFNLAYDINLISTDIDIQTYQEVTKFNLPFDTVDSYFHSIIETKYTHYIQIFFDDSKLCGSRQNVGTAFFILNIFARQFNLPPTVTSIFTEELWYFIFPVLHPVNNMWCTVS